MTTSARGIQARTDPVRVPTGYGNTSWLGSSVTKQRRSVWFARSSNQAADQHRRACSVHGWEPVVAAVRRASPGQVSAISASLRLPELEVLTVSQVAERVVRNHQRRSGTTVSSDFAGLPEQVSLPIKIALYRALEEGLSNAARHGDAKDVQARIRVEDGQLCLAVCDQGPGFDTAQLTAGGRLGLAAVQERAALLGGHARVESAPGRGTTLWVWLPLSAPRS